MLNKLRTEVLTKWLKKFCGEIMGTFKKQMFLQSPEIANELDSEAEMSARCKKILTSYQTRKYTSEQALLDAIDWHLEKGYSYHVVTWGDIDSLSYLLFVAKQQKIHHVVISTWAMNNKDIEDIGALLKKGVIEKCDFYVGEIFKTRYSKEHQMLRQLAQKYGCKIVLFRNHAKVMAIKGEHYDCVIESSANINRNPRCEQTVITVDTELTDWYIQFYSEIRSFE